MAMDVEAEIRDRKRHGGEREGSFGFLAEQIKTVHRDLLRFQARTEQWFEKLDDRFDQLDGRLGKMDGRLDRVEGGLRKLRDDMPGIVSNAMREVLRGRNGKSRKKP